MTRRLIVSDFNDFDNFDFDHDFSHALLEYSKPCGAVW